MNRITRRDFLDGVALAIAAGMTPAKLFAQSVAGAYPPGQTGWRGGTPAAYEIAHGVRDGRKYAIGALPVEETWDLVVVGAGISGLAAAHFFRQKWPRARILILENHDEFGGHARRNEFLVDGRTLIGYGGSEAIQSPEHEWSDVALGLLKELGVDVKRFETAFDRRLYPGLGLSRGVFFTKEAFGVDKLVTGDPMRMVADDIPADRLNARPWPAFLADYPLDAAQRAKLLALFTEKRDVLAGKSPAEKEELLAKTSYRDFIRKFWGLDDVSANTFQGRSDDFFAIGIDGVPAYDAMETGYPGFQGLGLERSAESAAEMDDPYIHHFPDGNASIARLLVRKLIPAVASGHTMDDVVTARFDYDKLDVPDAPVRLRLGSTVVSLRNRSYGKADVGYVRDGKLHRVQAAQAIYAGYGMMLPYICADVPPAQKTALAAGVKAPLVYVNVAVRNWRPWVKLGVHEITNPMGFFSRLKLDYPVSLGDYQFSAGPDQPMVLHLVHVPTLPAGSGADQRSAWRAARALLYTMTFDDFEQKVRDELTRMLGPGGFVADRDIAAITVNRWGHGYAYGFNSLWDEEHDPEVNVVAQARIGRIGIAGSDAAWSAYAHAAIDEAHRAVSEMGSDPIS
ncbi:MAG TPA: NAD(P)-binding protein [Steroidobacteraceae bacterium]|nr:NAD(P)-binding protein [Steroidobacteraceae bacterium]